MDWKKACYKKKNDGSLIKFDDSPLAPEGANVHQTKSALIFKSTNNIKTINKYFVFF